MADYQERVNAEFEQIEPSLNLRDIGQKVMFSLIEA
jgi:hypothetical protein